MIAAQMDETFVSQHKTKNKKNKQSSNTQLVSVSNKRKKKQHCFLRTTLKTSQAGTEENEKRLHLFPSQH